MKKILFAIVFIISLLCYNCARIGSPTGGDKDILPPEIVQENPPSGTKNFSGNRIRVYFNELIQLKDVRKQLIISPPLNNLPEITPNSASRYIDIRFSDTLRANTTYSFNFGNSIQDYNEGNPFSFYKYVFSTGNEIDSLKVSGEISDALLAEPDNFVSVFLYEANEKPLDSIVYKEKPYYATNTMDSLTTFQITNVKAGKYLLVALKDKANNYLFDPKTDKIAFHSQLIQVPSDTTYVLKLFKELPRKLVKRPFQAAQKRISLGYEGSKEDIEIRFLEPKPKDFSYLISKDADKDTLNIWLSHKIEDSLKMVVRNEKIDTFRVNFRKMKVDSLEIGLKNNSRSPFEEEIELRANIPIVSYDEKGIKILKNDSIPVDFSSEMKEDKLKMIVRLKTKPESKYKMLVLPKTLTDFYGNKNDTITSEFSSKKKEDFASFKLNFQTKRKFPLLVQLTNKKGSDVFYEQYLEEEVASVFFQYVKAGKYFIRIIEDENRNKKWDTGNFLERKQPENVYHFKKEVDLRANWEIQELY